MTLGCGLIQKELGTTVLVLVGLLGIELDELLRNEAQGKHHAV